jgi:hypothetical protein
LLSVGKWPAPGFLAEIGDERLGAAVALGRSTPDHAIVGSRVCDDGVRDFLRRVAVRLREDIADLQVEAAVEACLVWIGEKLGCQSEC